MIVVLQLRFDQRARELHGLENDARPEKHFVRAVTLLGADLRPQSFGFFRVPYFKEALLAEITERAMRFANANVAIGVDHAR